MDQVASAIRKHNAAGTGDVGREKRKNEALRKLAYYVDGIRRRHHGQED